MPKLGPEYAYVKVKWALENNCIIMMGRAIEVNKIGAFLNKDEIWNNSNAIFFKYNTIMNFPEGMYIVKKNDNIKKFLIDSISGITNDNWDQVYAVLHPPYTGLTENDMPMEDFLRNFKYFVMGGKILEKERINKMINDYKIKAFIVKMLKQKIDETDIIDFKFCFKPKDKIAKTISAFCNKFALSERDSYIVFGIKDKKDLPEKFETKDRIFELDKMLEASDVSTSEEFQFLVNDTVEKHLHPNPDPCYTIKNLNLVNHGPFETDTPIIIIHIHNFTPETPIYFHKEIYIRKNGQDKKAKHDEIVELMNKIQKK